MFASETVGCLLCSLLLLLLLRKTQDEANCCLCRELRAHYKSDWQFCLSGGHYVVVVVVVGSKQRELCASLVVFESAAG